MYDNPQNNTVTTAKDNRITNLGASIRKYKLDELTQLFNVLKGNMSFVGPRPDTLEYANLVNSKEDLIIYSVKPGITGLATIFYRKEEEILEAQENPIEYNKKVIWIHKVKLNKRYIKEWSLYLDFKIICATIFNQNIINP